jgi:predicted phage tail protein
MDQVDELLDTIAAHKEMGVTGASVMFFFSKRRVQPIQQRHILGFEYKGAEDPSRMCAKKLTDEAALTRVRRVLLDVDAVCCTKSSEAGKCSTTLC